MLEIKVIEAEEETPICPYCEQEITSVFVNKMGGFLGVRYVYFCRNCRKVLGVSHRKGFWMG